MRHLCGASRCLVSAVLAVQTSCTADATSEPGTVVVRDSAGIRIVESAAPVWGEGVGWTVEPEPALEIGAEVHDSTHFLYGALDVERLEDGRLVVENRGTSQLLVYDSLGAFVEGVGREGGGPGEFERMRGLYRCGGDTLVENGLYLVTLFDAKLNFVRTARIHRQPDDRNPEIKGVAPDCSALLIEDHHPPPRPTRGASTWSLHWLYWDATASGERDTVAAVVPGYEAVHFSYSGQTDNYVLPWGRQTAWAVKIDTVYLGLGDTPEIRVVDRRGTVRRFIRWTAEPAPVTAADRTRFTEWRQKRLRERPIEATFLPPLDRFPVPEKKPLYSDLKLDDEGNLWVREYPLPKNGWRNIYRPEAGTPPETWDVFDPQGRWLGPVEMPAALDVFRIQGGYVIGRWRDELDVERLRLHRIHKP